MKGLEPIEVVRERFEAILKEGPANPLYRLMNAPCKPWTGQEGYVYIFNEPRSSVYKIGASRHLRQRFSAICRQRRQKLYLVFAGPVQRPFQLEARLHRNFRDHRIGGEWFDLSKEQVQQAIQEIRDNETDD